MKTTIDPDARREMIETLKAWMDEIALIFRHFVTLTRTTLLSEDPEEFLPTYEFCGGAYPVKCMALMAGNIGQITICVYSRHGLVQRNSIHLVIEYRYGRGWFTSIVGTHNNEEEHADICRLAATLWSDVAAQLTDARKVSVEEQKIGGALYQLALLLSHETYRSHTLH